MAGGIETVFLLNREALLRFLRARGGAAEAEDLLHELWLKVSAARPEPIADPLAYLYRMANNLMLDRRRSALRSASRDREWSDLEAPARGEASEVASAERVVSAREQLQAVEAALSALGDRTSAIFRRYRIDGVSQQDIAREMDISLSAVEKHLQKAYRALVEIRRRLDAG